ncbi:MAG: hypothetical protein ACMVY4_14590 [Minwuia sp.]|uniref:hypothetical protein n=1 Tax=Minwuia sp. TaxID=2493630 RepID=UPI003A847303
MIKNLLALIATIAVLYYLGIFGGGERQEGISDNTSKLRISGAYSNQNECKFGEVTSGRFYVNAQDVNFRSGPGVKFDKIVNERATNIIGTITFRTLSKYMVLEGRCETSDWLNAEIVEADGASVNWGAGWVHKDFVSSRPSSEQSAGLLWDISSENAFTDNEKRFLIRKSLEILKNSKNCAKIITGYHSSRYPNSFYVTCIDASGGLPFNVWVKP